MFGLWSGRAHWCYLRLGSAVAVVRELLQSAIERSARFLFLGDKMNDDEDILSDVPADPIAPWEAWRCVVCDFLVYNLDENGYPASGAPSPKFVSTDYPIVCKACWALYASIDSSKYFSQLAREAREAGVDRIKRIKRLGPGGTYLD